MMRHTPMQRSTKRMRQGHSTGTPTKAEQARWDEMREIGCVACLINAEQGRPTMRPYAPKLDVHHFTNGGRRLGHDQSVLLCQWHHKGDWFPFESAGRAWHANEYGPTYHGEKKLFHTVYGNDVALLEYQNNLLTPPSEKAA